MGLLDDAIKEHLELKRRRGADAEEVARLEQEALGTAAARRVRGRGCARRGRRRRPLTRLAAVQAEPAPDTAEHAVGGARARAGSAHRSPSRSPRPSLPITPTRHGSTTSPGRPWSRWRSATTLPLDQPTVEYSPPADPPAEGEDVLEETPDFLQETPEHDRLWFEQKPPRDFDLDR